MIDYSIAVSLIAMVLILAIGSFRTGVASMLCDAQNGIDIENGVNNYLSQWYGYSEKALKLINGRATCRKRPGAQGNISWNQYWSYEDIW